MQCVILGLGAMKQRTNQFKGFNFSWKMTWRPKQPNLRVEIWAVWSKMAGCTLDGQEVSRVVSCNNHRLILLKQ